MGWADCGFDDKGRPIGYAHEAVCDFEDCDRKIDRGLSYVCGSMHGGGEFGCGGYFCSAHLHYYKTEQLCRACYDAQPEEVEDEGEVSP